MSIKLYNIQNLRGVVLSSWSPDEICSILYASAKIAKAYFNSMKWKRKKDKSLLTAADIEIEKLFSEFCDHERSGIFLIGEETISKKRKGYTEKALQKKCWILDPIDGTAPFACNIPTWGISLAFAEGGEIKDGAIFLPQLGELYITYDGKSYFAEGLSGNEKKLNLKKIPAVESANFAKGGLVSISQDIAKRGTILIDNPVQAVCCSVFSAAGVLRGRYSAFIGTMRLWDIAGAIPLLLNNGFIIETLDGFNLGSKIDFKLFSSEKISSSNDWLFRSNLLIAKNKKIICEIRKSLKQNQSSKSRGI